MAVQIPKIFHQIWLQGDMPEPYQYFRDHMMELHPGWEYRYWTYENMPKLKNQDFFDSVKRNMFKADILRYEILYEYGGVYVDTDMLLFKNIEELLFADYFVTRDQWSVQNCIFGFTPNHHVLQYLIMKLPENRKRFEEEKEKGYHWAGLENIGPNMLSEAFYSCMDNPYVYSRDFFFPSDFYKIKEDYQKSYPDAYGIHLYNSQYGWKYIDIHKTLPCYKRKFGLL